MDPRLKKKLAKVFQTPELQKVFTEFGREGGKRRAQKLSSTRRKAIARKAAAARWRKKRR